MRCAICDFDNVLKQNFNVNPMEVADPNNRVVEYRGESLCTDCLRQIERANTEFYIKRVEEMTLEELMADDGEIRPELIPDVWDLPQEVVEYDTLEFADGTGLEPGYQQDTVPELQDAGEGHK